MKRRLVLVISFLSCWISIFAQECDIALRTIITPPNNGVISAQAEGYLTNKLRHLTCHSNQLASLGNGQFGVVACYDVIDKQIISGAPTKIVYNLSLSLFIVDTKNMQIYNTYNCEVRGVGDNETKALINCFRTINISNKDIKKFVQSGKSNIIGYYNRNYQSIIASAKKLASLKNYDEAIYQLLTVPECCNGHAEVMAELKSIYKQFVNQHCAENLAQARAAWYSSPNSDGASVAGVFLSEIYPDADCYSDAMALYTEIKNKIGEDCKFTMKQYQDMIALEQQRINVMRDIAIAYVNSRPKENVNIFWK